MPLPTFIAFDENRSRRRLNWPPTHWCSRAQEAAEKLVRALSKYGCTAVASSTFEEQRQRCTLD